VIETPPHPTHAIKPEDGPSSALVKRVRTISEKTGVTLPITVILGSITTAAVFLYNGIVARMDAFEKRLSDTVTEATGIGNRVLKIEIDSKYDLEWKQRMERGMESVNNKLDVLTRKGTP